MSHLTRDELILLHYGEALPPGAREHLLLCAECRAERDLLGRVLDTVHTAQTPDPSAAWEAQLWNRLRWKLRRRRPRVRWYAAAAAMAIAALLAGRAWHHLSPQPVPSSSSVARGAPEPEPAPGDAAASAAAGAAGRERILLAAVGDHFGRSERLLTEVRNATTGAPALVAGERRAIEDLVRKNRLYREAAAAAGRRALASVLEEMEPLLLELARAPEQPSRRDVQTLQERIEKNGLVFKLRVAGDQIKRQQSL